MYTGCSSGLLSRAVASLSAISHPRQARYTRAHACALTHRSIHHSAPFQTLTCTHPSRRSGPGWGISELQESPASPPDLSLRQRGRRTGDFPTGGGHTRPTGHSPAPSQTFCVVPSPGTKAYAQSLGLTPQADLSPLPSRRPCSPSQPWDGCCYGGRADRKDIQATSPRSPEPRVGTCCGPPMCLDGTAVTFLRRTWGEAEPQRGPRRQDVPWSLAPCVGGTRRPPSPGASCRHGQRPPQGRGRW